MNKEQQWNFIRVAPVLLFGVLGAREAAAGGLWNYDIGSDEVGLATAGYAARAQDASTVLTNPAGMTRLKGTQAMVGVELFDDPNTFTQSSSVNSAGTGNGGTPIGMQTSGSAFITHQLPHDLTVGFGVASSFGGNLQYAGNWVGRYWNEESDLYGISVLPSVAYKVTRQFSIGVSLNAMYGSLVNKVAVNNALPGLGDGQLKLDDNHWGWGGNVGLLFELNPGTRFGLTYNSQVDLNFSPTAEFSGLGPGRNALLGGLGLLGATVNDDIRVPQGAMLSAYHEFNRGWAVMADVGWQQWSRFGQMEFSVQDNVASTRTITTQLNYSDTWHGAIGAQRHFDNAWTLNFGYAYDSGFQKSSNVSPSLPLNEQMRFGVGGQKEESKTMSWGVAFEYVYAQDVTFNRTSLLPVALGGRGNLMGTFNPSMYVIAANVTLKL
ncbi:MAG TPA: outer membrane protein transport protein [Burkholderiaceae bacterium]|nr:outer membrane protein transport protein [Burkholderiaceae bacterium]